MKKLKVGDRVKTSRPDGTGIIVEIDNSSVPYFVEFDKPVYWDNNVWCFRWFLDNSVTLLNKIQNKLK